MGRIGKIIESLNTLKQLVQVLWTTVSSGNEEIRNCLSFMTLNELMAAKALPVANTQFSHFTRDELMCMEERLVRENRSKHRLDLSKVRAELCRRDIGDVNALTALQKIVRLCSKSPHGRTTHVRLSRALWPREPFEGRGEGSRIMRALDAVMLLCFESGLPPLNLLVVSKINHDPARADLIKVYKFAKRLGVEVGSGPDEYVAAEMGVAKEICSYRSD